MSALGYALQEALVNLRRAGRSAAMSIGTIAIAFFTVGSFWLMSSNLQHVVDGWTSAAELSIYLRGDVSDTVRQDLLAELSAHPAVSSVEFVSSEGALDRFRSEFPELGDLAPAGENPFPAAFEVRLTPDPSAAAAAEALAVDLGARVGIADVRFDRQWLSRVLGMVSAVRLGGLAVAAVLVLGAAFTAAAVVRLSLEARRDEVDIMQLVGAPFAYVRGPFIAEGTLLGGMGAALSVAVLWGAFAMLRPRLGEVVTGFAPGGELGFLGPTDITLMLVAGLVVGALAGVTASRIAR